MRSVSATKFNEGGFALLPVLLLLSVLATTLVTASLSITSTVATINILHRQSEFDAAVKSSVEQVAFQILTETRTPPLAGSLAFKAGPASMRVSWISEAGRIDLNLAPANLMAAAFANLGVEEVPANAYAEMVVASRRTLQPGQQQVQSPVPLPFHHIRDLSQLGLPDAVVQRLANVFTVYAGTNKIDPRVAPPEVLASLPGITQARLREMLALRAARSSDANAWQEAAGETATFLQFSRPKTLRILVSYEQVGMPVRLAEIVMIMFSNDSEPFRIMDWQILQGVSYIPLDLAGT